MTHQLHLLTMNGDLLLVTTLKIHQLNLTLDMESLHPTQIVISMQLAIIKELEQQSQEKMTIQQNQE